MNRLFVVTLLAVPSVFSVLASAQTQRRGVTVVPVQGCFVLPGYSDATKIAGPWTIKVDGCRNAAASENACSVDGYGAGCDVNRTVEDKGIERGFVRF